MVMADNMKHTVLKYISTPSLEGNINITLCI
jgi:hypothetical protein